MRKEILFAIIAGALFGLVIAFGIWKANSANDNTTVDTAQNKEVAKDESLTPSDFSITIAKLENNQVLTKNPVKISGLTKPNTWVVISGEDDDYLTKSSENGSFEQDIELVGGVNEINFNAHDDVGKSSENKMILVYSTEFDEEENATD